VEEFQTPAAPARFLPGARATEHGKDARDPHRIQRRADDHPQRVKDVLRLSPRSRIDRLWFAFHNLLKSWELATKPV
jgi:hypothetical protein